MDFLHCALVAILVLLAIYCSRSFREGNDGNGQVPFTMSAVNPAGAPDGHAPSPCFQATVTASTPSGKRNARTIWETIHKDSNPNWSGLGLKNESCGARGFDTPGVESKALAYGAFGVIGPTLKKTLGVKVTPSKHVYTKLA